MRLQNIVNTVHLMTLIQRFLLSVFNEILEKGVGNQRKRLFHIPVKLLWPTNKQYPMLQ